MSFRTEDSNTLTGLLPSQTDEATLAKILRDTLDEGIHGFCFSPYCHDQKPGSPITVEQIQKRIDIITPHSKWIRTFSCTQGNQLIPEIAQKNGLNTIVGAWLSRDKSLNEQEIEQAIEVAKSGHANIVAVGNEVMYRKDLDENTLISYIERVKKALPDIPIGYVDAYYEFENRPAITDCCDVILANCYPYWERCTLDYSLLYMKEMYRTAVKAAQGKKVIITESGWPSDGTPLDTAVPSRANSMSYFINAQKWAKQDNIDLFYFSAFDEKWKDADEGDVGPHWGLWDTHGNLKY